jgi:hypothetical protein
MIVQSKMQVLLRRNDKLLYLQQIKLLSKAFNDDLRIILFVLYYILFIYDESILCFLIRCFIQLFLSTMIEDLNHSEELMPGVTRANAFNQLSRPNILLSSVNNNNNSTNDDQDTPIEEIETLFNDWPIDKKKILVSKLILFIITTWCGMFLFQLIFCLDNIFDGICYQINGNLNKHIRDTAYSNDNFTGSVIWSIKEAFMNGHFLLNIIGDMKFRSKFIKFLNILLLDFIIISLQLLALSLNYGIGLGLINRYDDEIDRNIDNIDNINNNRQFDGLQGRTLIFKLNPFQTFRSLFIRPRKSQHIKRLPT